MTIIKKFTAALTCTLSTILSAAVSFIVVVVIAAILVPCFAYDDGKARYNKKLKGI